MKSKKEQYNGNQKWQIVQKSDKRKSKKEWKHMHKI